MTDEELAVEEFYLERAKALDAYAGLEQSLVGLFDTILGTKDAKKAYIIFSNILNNRARRDILSELMDASYGQRYKVFFGSVLRKLAKLDAMRNKIVHWIVMSGTVDGEPFNPERHVALHQHPNIFGEGKVYRRELIEFRRRASFSTLLLFQFDLYLQSEEGLPAPDESHTWQEIFGTRIIYPPPTDHPLHRAYAEA